MGSEQSTEQTYLRAENVPQAKSYERPEKPGAYTMDHAIKVFKAVKCLNTDTNDPPSSKCIATLVIPVGATVVVPDMRFNHDGWPTTTSLRTSEAKVVQIESSRNPDVNPNKCRSTYDNTFKYKVGSTVKPTNGFSRDHTSEGSEKGIHFYTTYEQAMRRANNYSKY